MYAAKVGLAIAGVFALSLIPLEVHTRSRRTTGTTRAGMACTTTCRSQYMLNRNLLGWKTPYQ